MSYVIDRLKDAKTEAASRSNRAEGIIDEVIKLLEEEEAKPAKKKESTQNAKGKTEKP